MDNDKLTHELRINITFHYFSFIFINLIYSFRNFQLNT